MQTAHDIEMINRRYKYKMREMVEQRRKDMIKYGHRYPPEPARNQSLCPHLPIWEKAIIVGTVICCAIFAYFMIV